MQHIPTVHVLHVLHGPPVSGILVHHTGPSIPRDTQIDLAVMHDLRLRRRRRCRSRGKRAGRSILIVQGAGAAERMRCAHGHGDVALLAGASSEFGDAALEFLADTLHLLGEASLLGLFHAAAGGTLRLVGVGRRSPVIHATRRAADAVLRFDRHLKNDKQIINPSISIESIFHLFSHLSWVHIEYNVFQVCFSLYVFYGQKETEFSSHMLREIQVSSSISLQLFSISNWPHKQTNIQQKMHKRMKVLFKKVWILVFSIPPPPTFQNLNNFWVELNWLLFNFFLHIPTFYSIIIHKFIFYKNKIMTLLIERFSWTLKVDDGPKYQDGAGQAIKH